MLLSFVFCTSNTFKSTPVVKLVLLVRSVTESTLDCLCFKRAGGSDAHLRFSYCNKVSVKTTAVGDDTAELSFT